MVCLGDVFSFAVKYTTEVGVLAFVHTLLRNGGTHVCDHHVRLAFRDNELVGAIAMDMGIPLSSTLASNASMRVSRVERDAACEQLSAAGVPLKVNREESWQGFASLRHQYDFALIALVHFLHAPQSPWSSDRKLGLTVRDLFR